MELPQIASLIGGLHRTGTPIVADGVVSPADAVAPVLLHGDLHPGNVLDAGGPGHH